MSEVPMYLPDPQITGASAHAEHTRCATAFSFSTPCTEGAQEANNLSVSRKLRTPPLTASAATKWLYTWLWCEPRLLVVSLDS